MTTYLMKQFLIFIFFSFSLFTNAQEIAVLKYNGGGDWYSNPTALPNLIEFTNNNSDTKIKENPTFDYTLCIKPVAGRGSAGINEESVIENYYQLVKGVLERYKAIGQPVLIERFLKGREITFGILGNNEDIRALPPLEIMYSEGDVTLTYDKKEIDNDHFFCPAKLTKEKTSDFIRISGEIGESLNLMRNELVVIACKNNSTQAHIDYNDEINGGECELSYLIRKRLDIDDEVSEITIWKVDEKFRRSNILEN